LGTKDDVYMKVCHPYVIPIPELAELTDTCYCLTHTHHLHKFLFGSIYELQISCFVYWVDNFRNSLIGLAQW